VSGLASEDGQDTDPAEAAAKLADLLNGLFSSLDEIVVAFRGLLENANASGRRLRRSDLSALRPVLIRHLQQHQHLIMGTGVVLAPGLLADAPMWLEWWRSSPGDAPSALKLDLDPTSLGFYDYTQAEWYAAPSRGATRAVVGPFVDFGGTNEYTLAVTVPITERDSFLGVSGADLWATRLEATARRLMRGLRRDVVLVNGDDRVLASRSPRLVMGALVRDIKGAVRYPCPGLPWSMVALGGSIE
jgi:hypothetical protein